MSPAPRTRLPLAPFSFSLEQDNTRWFHVRRAWWVRRSVPSLSPGLALTRSHTLKLHACSAVGRHGCGLSLPAGVVLGRTPRHGTRRSGIAVGQTRCGSTPGGGYSAQRYASATPVETLGVRLVSARAGYGGISWDDRGCAGEQAECGSGRTGGAITAFPTV